MPIYEFKCLKCGEIVDLLFKNRNEQIEIKCPLCGSTNLERIMSTVAFGNSNHKESSKVTCQTRSCESGSCVTYMIPGWQKD